MSLLCRATLALQSPNTCGAGVIAHTFHRQNAGATIRGTPFAITIAQNRASKDCGTLAEGSKMHTISTSECAPNLDGAGPLAIEDALELMLSRVQQVSETEIVSTLNGLGRVLAADISSGIDVPG